MMSNRSKKWWFWTVPVLFLLLGISLSAKNINEYFNRNWFQFAERPAEPAVLLRNAKAIIPLADLENRKIASVNFGSAYTSHFDSILSKYAFVTSFSVHNSHSQTEISALNTHLKGFNTLIIEVTDATLNDIPVQKFITEQPKDKQLIVVLYGNPSALQFLDKVDCAVIWIAKNTPEASASVAQSVFGGLAFSGKLKQDISPAFKKGDGFATSVSRLAYTTPKDAGINSADLEPIDKIVEEAIAAKATPGAAVMVVKDGKVIFNKGYGSHTYAHERHTRADDIFDLASITKIGATTMAAMRLYEQQKLKLDTNIGAYIPAARSTDKNDLTVKELLLHEAGLVSYIPFHESLHVGDYSRDSTIFHPVKVADNYYLRANYFEDVMWPRMLRSRLSDRGKHRYSDLSMYMMKDIIERITAERLDKYVAAQFYAPMGMYTAGFNPRKRFAKDKIVPTEDDKFFRKTLLAGYVHDQGAAMAGGVSGHAGLFSSANDLAILFQMILNGGTYGGKQYFKPETIKFFTAKYSDVSRRGLGFDRWDPDRTNRYPSDLASPKTYGHTGYTGTCIWVDPKYNLIYIFLSNRVHPSVSNKLSSLRIRPRIHDVIYRAIEGGR